MSKHITPVSLVAGAALWIASDLIELASGGPTAVVLTLTAIAFGTLALGVQALRERAPGRAAAAALGLFSLGFVLMAVLALRMLAGGLSAHPEGPLFATAMGVYALGALGTAGVLGMRRPRWPGVWLGVASLVAMGGHGAEVPLVGVLGNIGISSLLIVLAVPALRGPSVEREVALGT